VFALCLYIPSGATLFLMGILFMGKLIVGILFINTPF